MSCYDPLMEKVVWTQKSSNILGYVMCLILSDCTRTNINCHATAQKKVALHYMKKYTPKYSLFNWKCCCDVAPHNMNLELVFIVLLEYNSR